MFPYFRHLLHLNRPRRTLLPRVPQNPTARRSAFFSKRSIAPRQNGSPSLQPSRPMELLKAKARDFSLRVTTKLASGSPEKVIPGREVFGLANCGGCMLARMTKNIAGGLSNGE